ncbi:hypothetical protein SAICODRAFT_29470 [Saitoella complicata NRRL Y-17804]|uniref:uncharacterized protein n=1 Tax=Saitoella complicata (strain BCRC 22490 / CBS 7301 / JCM 7358 / NBRC 10748 / NRRL Y-17804) TaxID=698492 RepID=UPI000867924B|nr:uncharacterized protein SAICODRAFT_29470 [Saitoella complicata NRRL Y-17804]ODQ54297.1 hypothetical protein SAICODRAFT_29470 [Saitoella complicata NRRL Y-17804]
MARVTGTLLFISSTSSAVVTSNSIDDLDDAGPEDCLRGLVVVLAVTDTEVDDEEGVELFREDRRRVVRSVGGSEAPVAKRMGWDTTGDRVVAIVC